MKGPLNGPVFLVFERIPSFTFRALFGPEPGQMGDISNQEFGNTLTGITCQSVEEYRGRKVSG